MRVLKGLAIGILGFFLFILLVAVGLATTANGTILSPTFISAQMDKFDVSLVIRDAIDEEIAGGGDFPPQIRTALLRTVDDAQAVVKQQVAVGLQSISDYLRGKKSDPELALLLRNTFFNEGFVNTLLDKVDIATLAEAFLTEELPSDVNTALVNALAANESELKAQAALAADPIFSYLLGETSSLDIAGTLRETLLTAELTTAFIEELDVAGMASDFIRQEATAQLAESYGFTVGNIDGLITSAITSVEQAVMDNADEILDYLLGLRQTLSIVVTLDELSADRVEVALKQAFAENLSSLYPDWDQMPQNEKDRALDAFLAGAMAVIPESIELDETMFSSGIGSQVTDALREAEQALATARTDISEAISSVEADLVEPRRYIGYFIGGYTVLMALLGLTALGIILVHRDVVGSTRQLGIVSLVYGVVQLLAVALTRNLVRTQIGVADIPAALRGLPDQIMNDVTGTLQTFGIAAAALGLILVVVSFLYPRLRPSSEFDY